MITITPGPDVAARIAGLKPGDVAELVGTFDFGTPYFRFSGTWATPIELDLSQAVMVTPWYLRSVNGLLLKGGEWRGGFRCDFGDNLAFEGAAFNGCGLGVNTGSNLRVSRNAFDGSQGTAVSAQKVDGVVSEENSFVRMTGDCHQFFGSRNVTVRKNVCKDGVPAIGAHPDFVQSGQVTGGLPMTGWVIEDNDISGPTQGLFLPDGVVATASRNRLEIELDNGISVGSGSVVTLDSNVLIPVAGHPTSARIIEYPGGQIVHVAPPVITVPPAPATAPPPPPEPEPTPVDPHIAILQKVDALAASGRKARAKNTWFDQIRAAIPKPIV